MRTDFRRALPSNGTGRRTCYVPSSSTVVNLPHVVEKGRLGPTTCRPSPGAALWAGLARRGSADGGQRRPWPLRLALLLVGVAAAGGVALLLRRRRSANADSRAALEGPAGSTRTRPDRFRRLGAASAAGRNALERHPGRRQSDRRGAVPAHRGPRTRPQSLKVRCLRATAQAQRVKSILARLDRSDLAIDGYDRLVLANPSAEELFQIDADQPEAKALAELQCQRLVQLLTSTRQRKTAGHRTDELEITDSRRPLPLVSGDRAEAGGRGRGRP